MWENIVERGRPQTTIWRMRIACRIPKATNTHSQYVIFTAFPPQKWLPEGISMLRYTHSACTLSVAQVTVFTVGLALFVMKGCEVQGELNFFKIPVASRRCRFSHLSSGSTHRMFRWRNARCVLPTGRHVRYSKCPGSKPIIGSRKTNEFHESCTWIVLTSSYFRGRLI
jgi:hypothetical protein